LGVILEAIALEILHDIRLAVGRVHLAERLGARVAELRQAAVGLPVALEEPRQIVVRFREECAAGHAIRQGSQDQPFARLGQIERIEMAGANVDQRQRLVWGHIEAAAQGVADLLPDATAVGREPEYLALAYEHVRRLVWGADKRRG